MRFLPISAGSMSAWMTSAPGANESRLPVTRSSKRAPSEMIRSLRCSAGDGRDRAVHAGHAEVLRVAVGQGAARHQRGHHRDAGQVGQLQQLARGAGPDRAAADVEHRPLGVQDQPDRLLDLLGVRPGHRAVAGQVQLGRARRTTSWPAARTSRRRPAPGPGRPVEAMWNASAIVRGISAGSVTRKLCLVTGIVMPRMSASWKASVPIELAPTWPVMATIGTESMWASASGRDQVGGARARGRHAHAHAAGRRGVPLGGVAGTLLVPHQDVPDRGVHQRVVRREDRAAGDAEDVPGARRLERRDQALGAAHRRARSCDGVITVSCLAVCAVGSREQKTPRPGRRGVTRGASLGSTRASGAYEKRRCAWHHGPRRAVVAVKPSLSAVPLSGTAGLGRSGPGPGQSRPRRGADAGLVALGVGQHGERGRVSSDDQGPAGRQRRGDRAPGPPPAARARRGGTAAGARRAARSAGTTASQRAAGRHLDVVGCPSPSTALQNGSIAAWSAVSSPMSTTESRDGSAATPSSAAASLICRARSRSREVTPKTSWLHRVDVARAGSAGRRRDGGWPPRRARRSGSPGRGRWRSHRSRSAWQRLEASAASRSARRPRPRSKVIVCGIVMAPPCTPTGWNSQAGGPIGAGSLLLSGFSAYGQPACEPGHIRARPRRHGGTIRPPSSRKVVCVTARTRRAGLAVVAAATAVTTAWGTAAQAQSTSHQREEATRPPT